MRADLAEIRDLIRRDVPALPVWPKVFRSPGYLKRQREAAPVDIRAAPSLVPTLKVFGNSAKNDEMMTSPAVPRNIEPSAVPVPMSVKPAQKTVQLPVIGLPLSSQPTADVVVKKHVQKVKNAKTPQSVGYLKDYVADQPDAAQSRRQARKKTFWKHHKACRKAAEGKKQSKTKTESVPVVVSEPASSSSTFKTIDAVDSREQVNVPSGSAVDSGKPADDRSDSASWNSLDKLINKGLRMRDGVPSDDKASNGSSWS